MPTPKTPMTPEERAPRSAVYRLVLSGTAAGLPIPQCIRMYLFDDFTSGLLDLDLDDDDRAGVDAWAAHLGAPEPKSGKLRDAGTPTQRCRYGGQLGPLASLSQWNVSVACTIAVPLPAAPDAVDAELHAAAIAATEAAEAAELAPVVATR